MQWLGTKKGQPGMSDAGTKVALRSAAFLEDFNHGERQAIPIVGAPVGETLFRLPPDLLVRIELRGIGRKGFETKPGNPATEIVHGREAMELQSVPQHDHRTAQVAKEVGEEGENFDQADVVMVPLVVEPEALAEGADRDPRDDRDAIVALPMPEQRRLATRRPGPQHGRREHEARFVYEDEVGSQPDGVFFTRGQTLRFQRAIAASSRSRAWRSGFCGLHPRACRSRLT